MLNLFARMAVSRALDPFGAWLVRRGLTPNAVTVIGAVISCAAALWFYPRGHLFIGSAVVTVFVLFDLIDGSMARAGGCVTRFGGVLDATCDRIVDGVVLGALTWWALETAHDRARALALLISLVAAQVISYVKARAEANGLRADGGVAERAERMVVILVGAGLHGLGVPLVLDIAVWLLAAISVTTIVQRLRAVHVGAREAGRA